MRFLQEVEFVKGEKVRYIIFEEEFIFFPVIAIDNNQDPIPDIVQNANPEHQENVEELPVQNEENYNWIANSTASRECAIENIH